MALGLLLIVSLALLLWNALRDPAPLPVPEEPRDTSDGEVVDPPSPAPGDPEPDTPPVPVAAPEPKPGAETPPSSRDGHLLVHLIGPDGKPVMGAHGEIRVGAATRVSLPRGTRVVNSNWLSVPKPTGRGADVLTFWVEIWREGRARFELPPFGAVLAGPFTADVARTEVLLPPERPLAGFVRDAEGKGVAGAVIRAFALWPEVAPRPGQKKPRSETTSGADGSFRLGRLGDTIYRLTVVPPVPFGAPLELEAQAGRGDVEFVLEEGLRATITVVDDEDLPVEGIYVRVGERTGKTDAAGRLLLTGLTPGPHKLYAMTGSRHAGLKTAVLPDWSPADTTVKLARDRIVAGVVRTLDGKPAKNVTVWRYSGKPDEGEWLDTPVREDGGFDVRRLGTEDILLVVTTPYMDPYSPGLPVTRVSPGTTEVVLTVDPGAAIEVVIEDWPKRSGTVLAAVTRGGTTHMRETSSRDGRFRLEGLHPEDRLAVWIMIYKGTRCWFGEKLRPGGEAITARLVTGRTIRGRVLVAPGSRAAVRIEGQGLSYGFRTASDGTFRTPPIPPGTWILKALVLTEGRLKTRSMPVTGDADVEFDLR